MTIRADEYPFKGTITRVESSDTFGGDDSETIIYDGVMDCNLGEVSIGTTLQTSGYVVCIPLVEDKQGNKVMPIKSDSIIVDMYGSKVELIVDNAIPSQIGGITIHANRKAF